MYFSLLHLTVGNIFLMVKPEMRIGVGCPPSLQPLPQVLAFGVRGSGVHADKQADLLWVGDWGDREEDVGSLPELFAQSTRNILPSCTLGASQL